jgi:hypothetical protein
MLERLGDGVQVAHAIIDNCDEGHISKQKQQPGDG